MTWNDIVNKGVDSWAIITANQPNPALPNTFCNAVPDVDDWATLSDRNTSGWTTPLKRTIPILPPLFDVEIPAIDIEWRLWYQYGNQYKGKGMFLKTIWTEVLKCEVGWGFEVSVGFQCSQPWNDNHDDPNWPAAMINLGMWATIKTPKWQKTVDKWRYSLNYAGSLVVA
jgi:hypothetical protein